MPFSEELRSSIFGAWRIAHLDADAMRHFNLSIDGFWRSFAAAPLTAPAFLLIAALTRAAPGDEAMAEPLGGYLLGRLLLFVVAWVAFPVVMIPVARLLNLSQTYVPFIIAWNWSQVLVVVVFLVASLLFASGLLPVGAATLVFMFAYVSVLFYQYLVTRLALDCPPLMAVGVVALDLVLSLLINAGADRWL